MAERDRLHQAMVKEQESQRELASRRESEAAAHGGADLDDSTPYSPGARVLLHNITSGDKLAYVLEYRENKNMNSKHQVQVQGEPKPRLVTLFNKKPTPHRFAYMGQQALGHGAAFEITAKRRSEYGFKRVLEGVKILS